MYQLLSHVETAQLFLFYKKMFEVLSFFLFIGLFIFGMMLVRSGLFSLSAPTLNRWIVASSDSTWRGLISGILITTMIQSSSSNLT